VSLARPARRERVALAVQRGVALALAPLWTAAVALAIAAARLRFDDLAGTRRAYRALRARPGPLLVCANHLTLVDSFLVAFALGHPAWYLAHFASLPWNVPEATIWASTPLRRAATWLMKCVPIVRGGERDAVAATLARLAFLLGRDEVVLVFPEGGRSRTGGVDAEARTIGVGRLLRAVPGCRVLCVHLRGVGQEAMSDLPRRGERFRVSLSCLEPKSEGKGLRGTLELNQQVLRELARLEQRAGFAPGAGSGST
jgi:1-acyl-sn-glycerol-3-phosphate acyltransferase